MSPDLLGLTIGIVFIIPTIYLIRAKEWDSFAWPLFLVTLPIYYMLFGVLALDGNAMLNEFLFGLPYMIIGLVGWRLRSKFSLIVIALAWLSHGLYDFYHDLFFINPGVFTWYPAFCAFVDISVAGYVFASYSKLATPSKSNIAR